MTLNTTMVDVAAKDLSGAALDFLVAQVDPVCQELKWEWKGNYMAGKDPDTGVTCCFISKSNFVIASRFTRDLEAPRYYPSSNWAQGGALIDKHRMSFAASGTGPRDEHGNQPIVAIGDELNWKAGEGPTHLIAACRSIVRGALGDIVKVPACLVLP